MSDNDTTDRGMTDQGLTDQSPQWWFAVVGDTLIWARLSVLEDGLAEVFDSDGGILRYDDETAARMALLDAEFRAFDGIDEDDAAAFGFDLEEVEPPRADDDEDLLPHMVQKLPTRH